MAKVQLTISGLTADIDSGLTRKEISVKYGLPVTQIAKAITMAGLKGKRANAPKFELIDDTSLDYSEIAVLDDGKMTLFPEQPLPENNYNYHPNN